MNCEEIQKRIDALGKANLDLQEKFHQVVAERDSQGALRIEYAMGHVCDEAAMFQIALQLCRCADTLGEIKYHMEKLRAGK